MIDTRKILGAARQRPRRVCAIMWVIMCWAAAAHIQHSAYLDHSVSHNMFLRERGCEIYNKCLLKGEPHQEGK